MTEQAYQELIKTMEHMANNPYTIELDCPPGGTRPGDLIGGVIKDTGLPEQETVSRVFGCWTWDYSGVEGIAELWPKIQPTLKERVGALYSMGTIRYGSW